MRATCYFSYSWDDADDKFMDELKKTIEDLSKHEMEVLYDKRKLEIGDAISDIEKRILTVDLIIIFFTPSYKTKVLSQDNQYGAFREYDNILKRVSNGFSYVLPIIVCGDKTKSVTDEFLNTIYEDITPIANRYSNVSVDKHKTVFSPELKKVITKIAKTTIKKSKASAWIRTYNFTTFDEEYAKLFLNTAATIDNQDFPKDCIVHMNAYRIILDQQADFVIGRKGSGKTTFLNMIYHYNSDWFIKHFKEPIAVSAESFNFNYMYEALIMKNASDLNIISISKILDVFWEVFFVLHCVNNIKNELNNFKIDDNDDRKHNFQKVVNKLQKSLSPKKRNLNTKMDIFPLAVEIVADFLNEKIFNLVNATTLISSIAHNFTANNILETFFGTKPFIDFSNNISRCTNQIFIAIDGYDTQSEDFRRQTHDLEKTNFDEYKLRKEFEILFYRELTYTVYNIKTSQKCPYLDDLYKKINFCVIIPQDRFDELKLYDRDIAKRKFCCLSWDAYDLLEMLIRRLEFCFQIPHKQGDNLLQQFETIINQYLPSIPTYITIEINNFDYSMPLFNYILRLSFWRPRDIIKNFARIFKLANQSIKPDPISVQDIIKDSLANSAREIIEDEFFNEYHNTFSNLPFILHQFDGCDIIMNDQDFCKILSRTKFEASTTGYINNIEEKIFLLYELGVVGLYHNKDLIKKLKKYGYHICFVFNEGLQPIEDYLNYQLGTETATKFIFNPIFSKYLSLNLNTEELIGNYPYDYIFKNHLMKDNIRRL